MRIRTLAWALGVVAAFAFVAAGCGGGGGNNSANNNTGAAGNTNANAGTLTVAIGSEPPSLDPGLATDTTSSYVVMNINTPIVRLGPAPDLQPEPALAQSWDVSGSKITLHLRDDVTWTDGTPVTANDVVWSWLRTISPQLGADYAYQFYGIKGAQEYNSCKPSGSNNQCNDLRSKVGLSAPDDTTVQITLTNPQPWFMQQLSHVSFIPVNKKAVETYGDKWTAPGHIVTDGPFKLTSWKHDASLTLKKNDGWYDASSVKLNTVNLKIITDGSTALQAFNAGNVDVNDTGWPVSETARLKQTPEYHQFPALGIYYYGFNVKTVPDVNQRKAMALAIDRKTIVENITQAGQVPAPSFTPDGMPGSDTINQGSDFLKPTADMTLANQYMSKVKNPQKDITLIFNDAPGHKEIAVAIQSQWQKLGLHVTLKQQDWPQFLQFLGPPPNNSVNAFRMGWVADFPDDINFLSVLQCGSGNNYTNWCNKEFDSDLQKATAASDEDTRYSYYQKAEQILTGKNGDMPVAPIYWYTYANLQKSYVQGYEINPMDEIDLAKVSVSK
ncbi:MAG TPA: peptide ABC transporter substrate-binding protein [Gaiellaceae bacterium]|nr:peptide ABC transporter substrate-binding protein [Gaiellaceae bacterium]